MTFSRSLGTLQQPGSANLEPEQMSGDTVLTNHQFYAVLCECASKITTRKAGIIYMNVYMYYASFPGCDFASTFSSTYF